MLTLIHPHLARSFSQQKSSELRDRACRAALVRRAARRPQR
ncbi:hypothetical protein [Streptacidiphilus jiangxiensis]|uniref:Uncharacterized protein n=1 Tax=Streptacidiphilus jiangxiensis TaxID=235985 RepID=A0A1H7VBJ1_STRJI|nr:hypothetical protein [Streptacidiphilus jiangxiensis]SEM06238.1 hypothetical protein SAMN05414137_117199 [Streptacidiphilus jiangxiensis]